MEDLKTGDVVVLPLGAVVLASRRDLMTLDRDAECVIESVRHFVDLRPLTDGAYDESQPILTVALSGDFEPRFIQASLVPVRHMRKTYV